ncbi:MAG: hypothetical protein R8M71_03115 [Alphaproteobacteria bacterium]|nr:hypothetical protein [Alphaproteobacteria bacterium]
MNKYLILILCFVITGCMSTTARIEQAKEIANNLEVKKDTIDTIETYKSIYETCFYINKTVEWIDDIDYDVYKCEQKVTKDAQCNEIKIQELAIRDADMSCIFLGWKTGKNYSSDDCIIKRRQTANSASCYFDYKRFLPQNTNIKTDDDFYNLVKYYNKINDCDTMSQATTTEKQECRDRIRENTIKMATTGINCMEVYKDEYTEELNSEGRWYEWAIDHDPYGAKKTLMWLGEYTAAHFTPTQPVYSKQEALNTVKRAIQTFGREHVCKIDGWQADIRKLGYKL